MPNVNPVGPPLENDRLLFVGLLGFSALSVVQMLNLSTLTVLQLVSLYFFAGSIPLLTASLCVATRTGQRMPWGVEWGRRLLDLAGVLGAVGGFALLLFHLSTGAGFLFSGASFLSLVLVMALFIIRNR